MIMFEVNHPLKFVFIGTAAFVATCLCFYLMMFMIAREFNQEIELETVYVAPLSISKQRPIEKVAARERARKVMPANPPPEPALYGHHQRQQPI